MALLKVFWNILDHLTTPDYIHLIFGIYQISISKVVNEGILALKIWQKKWTVINKPFPRNKFSAPRFFHRPQESRTVDLYAYQSTSITIFISQEDTLQNKFLHNKYSIVL